MPGKHSPEKLAARRMRALARGYLKEKSRHSFTTQGCGSSGEKFPRVQSACRVASELNDDIIFLRDPWSNCGPGHSGETLGAFTSQSCVLRLTDVSRKASSAKSDGRQINDIVFLNDPWFRTGSAHSEVVAPAPPRGGESQLKNNFDTELPGDITNSSGADGSSNDYQQLYFAASQLLEQQNSTIALLRAHFEWLLGTPSSGDPHSNDGEALQLSSRLSSLEKDVRKLADSLGSTVRSVVEVRIAETMKPRLDGLASIVEDLVSKQTRGELNAVREGSPETSATPRGDLSDAIQNLEIEKRFHSLLRPHVVDILSIVEEDVGQKIKLAMGVVTETCIARISELLKMYDRSIQKDLNELRSLIDVSLATDIEENLANSGSEMHGPANESVRTTELSGSPMSGDSSFKNATVVEMSGPNVSATVPPIGVAPASSRDVCVSRKISCDLFLERAKNAKLNKPYIPERPTQMPMLCDGFHDPDSDAKSVENSVDSELSSNPPLENEYYSSSGSVSAYPNVYLKENVRSLRERALTVDWQA